MKEAVENVVASLRMRAAGKQRRVLQWQELARALGEHPLRASAVPLHPAEMHPYASYDLNVGHPVCITSKPWGRKGNPGSIYQALSHFEL